MVFFILSPYKIEALEHQLTDFLADDVVHTIQLELTKIATDDTCLKNLEKQYPTYHKYKITVGKF
jgi:hypothetical protein